MLQFRSVTKSYSSRVLFSDISFSLRPRERLGLVGKNGSGKSTLFKLITGEEAPDEGSVIIPKGYRVGHLEQHLKFTQATILKEVCLGLPREKRDQEYLGAIILAGLGFNEDDNSKAPHEFSGGFQIRLNLAKLILSEPNLLLLDEPTNYLDIVSMRWLTKFLREWKGELILISHDRSFMDSVTTDSCFIHRGSLIKQPGGTEKLYSRVKEEEELYEKARINEDKKRKEVEQFINRFRAQASKATLVQSKVKELARMGQKDELAEEVVLDFRFCEAPFPGRQMLEVEGLSFSYNNDKPIVKGLNLAVNKKDRIGIIGKNGKGKSTLLKLLISELTPNTGTVALNQNARVGYFGQTNISRLSPELTIEQEVSDANSELHRTKVRAICGTMMFSGDDALKKISVLSGGEKSRVLLGKILAQPTNLLLLDEPTNHLDMESIEALIESLESYQGAVIIVTHSELILRKLVNRLIVFREGNPEVIEHGYDYFLEKYGWGESEEMSSSSQKIKSRLNINTNQTNADKTPRTKEEDIAEREQKISLLEKELHQIELAMTAATEIHDLFKLEKLTHDYSEVQAAIDTEYEELDKLMS